MTEADRQAGVLREELGHLAWDTLEEYFPEQAKARRRRHRLRMLAVGVVLGLAARAAVRMWLRRR